MEQLITAEESYVERRKLFKDIWATTMNIDEKDPEYLNKPKVIKTLRLDSVDRSAGKKKRQRIRNLRTVCNRILDFCDKQDAEDIFYAQMIAKGHISPTSKMKISPMKRKIKKKVRKSRSLLSSIEESSPKSVTTSMQKRQDSTNSGKTTSPIKLEGKKHVISNKAFPIAVEAMNSPVEASRRKTVKKKVDKRRRPSDDLIPPQGIMDDWP